ncbi:hypothetical protein [Fibrobacter sp. UWB10]|uniref:hypothetical protein n=1 Tax=Fibrobacter sp. UWB10 TaxID=1896201 RepID=UPI0024037A27|nr:hypothetical protein [Fibrobacter sp. UWB10]SMP55304.1 hypothetical protein SAMN05720465_2423 [Fibrobacter sp. UWB10]
MKKFLIILLISAIPFLLVVGFCGYHLYRVLSLDPGFFLSDEDFHSSEKALDMLIYSKHFSQGLACGEVPRYMREDNFDPKELLEVGATADFFFKLPEIPGQQSEYELSQRYVRDSLEGELRSTWGEGTLFTHYSKDDSCFRVATEIKAESADSVVTLMTDFSGNSGLYVGKRKNGVVTECVACKWRDGHCDEVISENKMKLDSVSGKMLSYTFNTREVYAEGTLHVSDGLGAEEMLFDNLQRPVLYKIGGHFYRYEYSSNDTADYSVKIFDESKRNVAFYKRKFKENREIVKYGGKRYEMEITRYYENEKLVKEISDEIWFYKFVNSRTKLFDAAGNSVLDSSFYEETFFPGWRYSPNSVITTHEYGENGKLKSYAQYKESYWRDFPFVFLPLHFESRDKIGKLSLDYNEAGLLKSVTDSTMLRIVFSNEKLDNVKECKDPYQPSSYLNP